MRNNYTISYAQNREDIILSGFFKDVSKGFYVDVGAEHPTKLSVTKLFYDKGWNGINIEPIKQEFDLFVKERPRDINLNIGIANKEGVLAFREYEGTGLSTFSEKEKIVHLSDEEQWAKSYKDYYVKVEPLKAVFEKYKVHAIQILKIDVEGFEYEVIKSNDWTKFRPEVVCIEANKIIKDWRPYLINQSYELVFFDGLNEYYADSNTTRASKFNYVQDVIYKAPIISEDILNTLDTYEVASAILNDRIDLLEHDLVITQEYAKTIQDKFNEIASLKSHVKLYVRIKLKKIDFIITKRLSRAISFSAPDMAIDFSLDRDSLSSNAYSYDKEVFRLFNGTTREGIAMVGYVKSKRIVYKFLHKLIGKG